MTKKTIPRTINVLLFFSCRHKNALKEDELAMGKKKTKLYKKKDEIGPVDAVAIEIELKSAPNNLIYETKKKDSLVAGSANKSNKKRPKSSSEKMQQHLDVYVQDDKSEMVMNSNSMNHGRNDSSEMVNPMSNQGSGEIKQLEDEIDLLKQKKNKASNDDDEDEEARLKTMIKQAKAKLSELKKNPSKKNGNQKKKPITANIGINKTSSAALPAGWDKDKDPASGKTYYFNRALKLTSWTIPTAEPEVSTKKKKGKEAKKNLPSQKRKKQCKTNTTHSRFTSTPWYITTNQTKIFTYNRSVKI